MHSYEVFYGIFLLALASCEFMVNNPSDVSADTTTNSTPPVTIVNDNLSGCYMQVMERDTFIAKIQVNGHEVSGSLIFDNYQKDGSRGTVAGKRSGDTLKLQYVFTSEGMNSVMEVYFKVENDELVRGIGDMAAKGDTAYFTNPAQVSYPRSTVLERVECKEIDHAQ